MPTHMYITVIIGISMLGFLIYELITGKAYGLWQMGRAKELNTRWHTRADDPLIYWKIVAKRALISIILIGYVIRDLLK